MQTPSYPNDPKAFLEHSAYLRRLARGLLGDPGAAEDLVQEAWLASLKAQPREGVPLRAWLAGWVRQRSMQKRREERRRTWREAAAARPDRQSPESETTERLEVLQFVLRTVESLDEPYRTAIRLRFLDDLPAREVAARLGLPVNTVRTRLRRGLAQVRAKLDTDCPGGRSALLSALVPLAGPLSAATKAAATTVVGATVMQSKFALAALAVAIVACSLLGWRLTNAEREPLPATDSDAGVQALGTAAESILDPAAAATLAAAAAAAPTRETAETAPAAESWMLTGKAIRGTKDTPFPGAKVRMRIYPGTAPDRQDFSEPSVQPTEQAELVADASGRLQWRGQRPAQDCWIELVGQTPDYTSMTVRLDARLGQPAPELMVWLAPLDFSIAGHVRDEHGRGIEGASVGTAWLYTKTGPGGSYHLRLTSSNDQAYITGSAPGYAHQRLVVQPVAGSDMDQVDFALRDEYVVTGRITDANGAPLAGAEVESFQLMGSEVLSKADGTYRLVGLDPGRPEHAIAARKSGYVMFMSSIPTGNGKLGQLDFQLASGVHVSGRVLDEARQPVVGAELYIGSSPADYQRIDATSDAEGRFAFDAVASGSHNLTAQAPGLASTSMELIVPVDGTQLQGVEVAMTKGAFLGGQVVDPGGDPIAGAWVMTEHQGEHIDPRDLTDAAGRFRIEHLPDSEVGVHVVSEGYVRLEQDVAQLDRSDLRLVLERAGTLAGKVIDGRTGKPLPSFQIRLVDPQPEPGERGRCSMRVSWIREGQRFDSPDGAWGYDRQDLRVGCITGVEASAEGYAPGVLARVPAQINPNPDEFVIALYPGTRLYGVVTLASSGLPVEGVRIKRFTSDKPLRDWDSDDVHGRMQTRTDANGYYEFAALPSEETHLALTHPTFGRWIVGPLSVYESDAQLEHNVAVSTDGVVHGKLIGPDGAPIAGGTIALRPRFIPGHTSDHDRRAVTDSDGTYLFDQLMNGEYEVAHEWLFPNGRQLRHFTRTVEILDGESRTLDLIPPGDSVLEVRLESPIQLPDTVPVYLTRTHDANGTALPSDTAHILGAIARQGSFRLAGLEAGTYRVWPNDFDQEQDAAVFGEATITCRPGSTDSLVVKLAIDE